MDNGLSRELKLLSVEVAEVLILIVMDNGLSLHHACGRSQGQES